MTYNVILKKVESMHENLRTDVIEGFCFDLPSVMEPFFMYSTSLDFSNGFRTIMTTPVQWIKYEGDNVMIFKTRNSVYELKHSLSEPVLDKEVSL